MASKPIRHVIAMGASAGGVESLGRVLERLPADLDAAVLVVLHTAATRTESHLAEIFDRRAAIEVATAQDGERLRPARVLVARPDRHLCVQDGRVWLDGGPRVNGHRPAVDVLFKSVAASHGAGAIGVVLTGNLDDGSLGLLAIRQAGGIGIVQEPSEAPYPGMPEAAIRVAEPDHVVSLARMPQLLRSLVRPTNGSAPKRTPRARSEKPVAAGSTGFPIDELPGADDTPGAPTGLTCPDCSGVIWMDESAGGTVFRCRIGHAYAPDAFFNQQTLFLEQALWAAIRSLRERRATALSMARSVEDAGRTDLAQTFRKRADEAQQYADEIQERLITHFW
ncbi:MAG: chemotaxis protein CheB [Candidatus Dormibacteria bacterium]